MANSENINKELEEAVQYKPNLERVKLLLAAGGNVNHTDERNRDSLLHLTKSVEITKELLLRGACVNKTNRWRETPLHHAVSYDKNLEQIRELLKHGADVNSINRKGYAALNIAVRIRNNPNSLQLIRDLLEYGADINIRTTAVGNYEYCNTPLENALSILPCAKLLISIVIIKNFSKDYKKIINLSSYKNYQNYDILSSYQDDCVNEILRMQTDYIIDSLSLFKLIMSNNSRSNTKLSNSLSLKLSKIDFSVKYPIYNDAILFRLKPFVERADLLNKLFKIHFYTKLDVLNQDVVENKIVLDTDTTYCISEYLSNVDLSNLVTAFDDSKICSSQSSTSFNSLLESDVNLCETVTSNDAKRPRFI